MGLTNAEKQAAYYARMRKAGMMRVCVWVPEGKGGAVRAFAALLSSDTIGEGGTEKAGFSDSQPVPK